MILYKCCNCVSKFLNIVDVKRYKLNPTGPPSFIWTWSRDTDMAVRCFVQAYDGMFYEHNMAVNSPYRPIMVNRSKDFHNIYPTKLASLLVGYLVDILIAYNTVIVLYEITVTYF